jgi:transcriptional regulator with XRE-family HTH domain
MKFGDKLALLRKQKGLSISEVAEKIGVSENAVAYYEKNVRKPRSKITVDALAQLLGCTVEELTDDSVDILPKSLPVEEPKKEPDKAVSEKTEPGPAVAVVKPEPAASVVKPEPAASVVKPEPAVCVVNAKPEPMAPAAVAAAKVTVERFSVNPDKYFKVGDKEKIRIGKKVAKISVSDKSIAKVRIKGKKITVKGKKPGTVTIIAYSKKDNVLGKWVIHVRDC